MGEVLNCKTDVNCSYRRMRLQAALSNLFRKSDESQRDQPEIYSIYDIISWWVDTKRQICRSNKIKDNFASRIVEAKRDRSWIKVFQKEAQMVCLFNPIEPSIVPVLRFTRLTYDLHIEFRLAVDFKSDKVDWLFFLHIKSGGLYFHIVFSTCPRAASFH